MTNIYKCVNSEIMIDEKCLICKDKTIDDYNIYLIKKHENNENFTSKSDFYFKPLCRKQVCKNKINLLIKIGKIQKTFCVSPVCDKFIFYSQELLGEINYCCQKHQKKCLSPFCLNYFYEDGENNLCEFHRNKCIAIVENDVIQCKKVVKIGNFCNFHRNNKLNIYNADENF